MENLLVVKNSLHLDKNKNGDNTVRRLMSGSHIMP